MPLQPSLTLIASPRQATPHSDAGNASGGQGGGASGGAGGSAYGGDGDGDAGRSAGDGHHGGASGVEGGGVVDGMGDAGVTAADSPLGMEQARTAWRERHGVQRVSAPDLLPCHTTRRVLHARSPALHVTEVCWLVRSANSAYHAVHRTLRVVHGRWLITPCHLGSHCSSRPLGRRQREIRRTLLLMASSILMAPVYHKLPLRSRCAPHGVRGMARDAWHVSPFPDLRCSMSHVAHRTLHVLGCAECTWLVCSACSARRAVDAMLRAVHM